MPSQALRDTLKQKVDAKGVYRFEGLLTDVLGESVPKDSQLYLTCKGEALHVSTTETTGPQISVKGLCPALFGVYLGKSPVAPPIKSGVATGFAKLE
jgi:hypothetical protein